MTTTAPGPGLSTDSAEKQQGWLRRHRTSAVLVAGLITATTFSVLGNHGSRYSGALDPQSADPSGAQAVARVLADQGIEVDVVRNAAEFDAARVYNSTTVVVTSPDNLGRGTARRLIAHSLGATLVLVAPQYGIPELFGGQEGIGYSRTRTVPARCDDQLFNGLTMATRTGTVYPLTSQACFPTGDGALLVRPQPDVLLIGAADLLSNEQITEADNAAIALRLLGQYHRVVWYVPSLADLSGGDGVSFGTLLPDWLRPGLVVVGVALIGLMLSRGRRLGALAVEPLPVAVTAIETTQSRGRLYRKVNDREHAAAALRYSARVRIAEHLNLPRHAALDVELMIRAVQPYSLLEPQRLRALLGDDPPPRNDRDLITLANDLAELRREVRRS